MIDLQQKFGLRRMLKEINAAIGVPMVPVTQDQTEAMTYAKKAIMMNPGEVVQAGSPRALFERPAIRHVGIIIGAPAMDFLPAELVAGRVVVSGSDLSLPVADGVPLDRLRLGIRPEHLRLRPGKPALSGTVSRCRFEGLGEIIALSHPAGELRLRLKAGVAVVPGDRIGSGPKPGALRLYRDDRLIARPPLSPGAAPVTTRRRNAPARRGPTRNGDRDRRWCRSGRNARPHARRCDAPPPHPARPAWPDGRRSP